jgi:hypothetical protein
VSKCGLTLKQQQAVNLLIGGRNAAQTARELDLHVNTLYKWNKLPEFQDALKQAEREAMRAVSISLLGLAEKATDTLNGVMDKDSARDSSKVRAADIVLGRLLQTRELLELEERISKLEERLNDKR